MIDAKEARKITDSIQSKAENILRLETLIKAAASQGKTSIRVPYDMVERDGYNQWLKADGLEDELRMLGYIINAKVEDGQFTDFWIEVSW